MTNASKGESAEFVDLTFAVSACLNEFGYKFTSDSARMDFRFRIHTESGRSWRSQILISPMERIARLFVFLTESPLEERRQSWLREVVERLNHEVGVLGSIAFNPDTSIAYYRTAVDLRGRTATAEDIERMLNAAALPVAVWEIAVQFEDKERASAEMAVRAALLLVGVSEEPLTKQALRSLLEIHNAEGEPVADQHSGGNPKLLLL